VFRVICFYAGFIEFIGNRREAWYSVGCTIFRRFIPVPDAYVEATEGRIIVSGITTQTIILKMIRFMCDYVEEVRISCSIHDIKKHDALGAIRLAK
jgi:hypothetical protein